MSALADAIQLEIEARGPQSADDLAVSVHKRRTDVLKTLRSDKRFVHTGKTKASRWNVRQSGPPPEAFRDAVYHARRTGEITGVEALELLISRSSQVLARFEREAA